MLRTLSVSRSPLVGLAVATLIACDKAPTAPVRMPDGPNAAVIANDVHLPFAFAVAACEETVNVSGTFHGVIASTVTPNGKTTDRFHINAKGIGIGATSDARYQWNDAINETVITAAGGGVRAVNVSQTTRLVGQGGVSDLLLRGRFHFTVNANGEVTAEVDVFEVICS